MLLFVPSGNAFIHALSTQHIQWFKSLSQKCNSARTVIVLVTQLNEDKNCIHRWCECFVSSVRAVCYRTTACKSFQSNNVHNILSRVQKEDRFISYADNILQLKKWREQWGISDFLGAGNKFTHGRFYHQCQPQELITTLNMKNYSVLIRSESCWRNTENKNC